MSDIRVNDIAYMVQRIHWNGKNFPPVSRVRKVRVEAIEELEVNGNIAIVSYAEETPGMTSLYTSYLFKTREEAGFSAILRGEDLVDF